MWDGGCAGSPQPAVSPSAGLACQPRVLAVAVVWLSAGYGPYLDDRRQEIIVDNARRFMRGEPLRNVVDTANWF